MGNYSHEQQAIIDKARQCGLPEHRIAVFSNPYLSLNEMESAYQRELMIYLALESYKRTSYPQPLFTPEQWNEIESAYVFGLPDKDVAIIACPDFPYQMMRQLRLAYEWGMPSRVVQALARSGLTWEEVACVVSEFAESPSNPTEWEGYTQTN